ncbi:MAG: hypothetical protein KAX49_18670 [Halanaerobiales bacterium]|nr:hypothetical protein [Halanaerobiales bacterium]
METIISKYIEKYLLVRAVAKYKHTEEQGEKRVLHKYEREPHEYTLSLELPKKPDFKNNAENEELKSLEINIECYVRKIFDDGSRLITVAVINEKTAPQKSIAQNEGAIFQCELHISAENSFIPIYKNDFINTGEEMLISNMLYSNIFNYAYGHGCSVKYDDTNGNVNSINSEFMPSEQVLQMMPNSLKKDNFLKMTYWRNVDRNLACTQLREFIEEYVAWCEDQEDQGAMLVNHNFAVKSSIAKIRTCIKRLERGVDFLKSNDIAWQSFLLMNEAMLLQRVKTKKCDENIIKWYPFQLAYILQIIPDIVDGSSDFRDFVDLLWFPTGGGKTEAYLGVCAFVIFYRRLLHKPSVDGVTIIMRYTLRLLTIQQFERATALICACEHLRKIHNISGGEINIGLWIGSNMTPNHISDAAEKLKELIEEPSKKIYEGNPIQIITCPWCGSTIDVGCYRVDHNMTIRCKNNKNCEFHNGLPIYLVDDDIYEKCPTLILGTVDKFARIVWEEKSKAIFGKDDFLPPELIIQDELHLISGPLGSITGIYEIAVEKLCERNGKTPKIIASTATVKNANEQIKNLYNKKMFQFPPNGISLDDSFFAVRADKTKRPARRYLGLCETGGSLADLLIRVYSNLIFTKNLFVKQGLSPDIVDQFYTTVGYFNAIKDLGASSSIINDRVSNHIKSLINHKFSAIAEQNGLTIRDIKNYEKHDELTSRKTSKEIKETLEQLSEPFTSDLCYSYVLASNMLSVGIDIDRLGVMTVYNQPKSNAEYIQATSRVGRNNPGVVLTMYNGMRSRDKSHYEQFSYYHKTLYQYVEATSVTPFSARAIEKALHCVFIALVRHTISGMSGNSDAVNFRNRLNGVDKIRIYILERVRSINMSAFDYAEDWIEYFAEEWERLAIENRDTLVYSDYRGGLCLLNPAEKSNDIGLPTTLNALRNVDSSSNVYILRREE